MTMSERLDHARSALTAYFEAKGEPLPEGPWDYEDTDASDLIADLLHLQKRLGFRDTERTLQTASLHFEAEEEEEPHQACGDNQSTHVRTDVFYVVTSSHGKLTINADGAVIARRLDNDDDGRHLGRIVRFDLVEWRSHWDDTLPSAFDILDLGYWYTDEDDVEAYSQADAKWRAEIAEAMFGRAVAGMKSGEAHLDKNIITVRVEGGLVQDVTGVPAGYELRVEDYDGDDTSHPSWDAEKECFVTIYEGAAT
jgi:hypothetical protein